MRLLKIAIPCAVLLSGYASLATQGSGGEAPAAIEPGQWELTTQMTSVEMPGAPEDLVRQMRASMADQRQVESQCITPEQARNPTQNLMGSQNPAGCQFSETVWAGGIIRIRATCRPSDSPSDTPSDTPSEGPPSIFPLQMSIEGTYGLQRIDNRINVTMEMPNPAGEGAPTQLRLEGRMTGRRTGACTSPPPEQPPEGNNVAAPVD